MGIEAMSNEARVRICKHLRSLGIDSKESILPAYVAWLAGTSNRVVVPARQAENRFLPGLLNRFTNSGSVLEFYNNLWGLGTE
jgi:hypothetical protein